MPKKKKNALVYILILSLLILFFMFGDSALSCARRSLESCARTIIPSLFPYMVLSELITKSGLGARLGSIFASPVRRALRISKEGGCAFVLGALCGFPIGAKTALSLYENKQISKSEAEHLLTFCNNTGPGFLISGVGVALFKSAKLGILFYASQILSALVIGLIATMFFKNKSTDQTKNLSCAPISIAALFTSAISSSAAGMVSVCGYIIFFSVLTGVVSQLLQTLFVPHLPLAFLSGLLEIFSGCEAVSTLRQDGLSFSVCAILCAFFVGWSGISIHAQSMAFCKDLDISFFPYIISKFFQGLLCALFVGIYFRFFPESLVPVGALAEKDPSMLGFLLSFSVNLLFIFAVLKNLIKKCGKKRFFMIL